MELLTPDEVSKLFKVNKRTLYYWIEKRKINHVKLNNKLIRFRPVDIQEFIEKNLVTSAGVDEVVDEIFSKITS